MEVEIEKGRIAITVPAAFFPFDRLKEAQMHGKQTETRSNPNQDARNKSIPNPRGNQTLPQPKPAVPRSPDGRFAREFNPRPRQTMP